MSAADPRRVGPATRPTGPTEPVGPSGPAVPPADAGLADAVRDLASLVADLSARVDHLEERLSQGGAGAAASEDLPPEVLIAISAAVAAYLGKRATVKQVRLRRDASWSAQGRAAIQQSHSIPHAR